MKLKWMPNCHPLATILIALLLLSGCATADGIHANREAEIEEAFNNGDITRKEYLDYKLSNDHNLFSYYSNSRGLKVKLED